MSEIDVVPLFEAIMSLAEVEHAAPLNQYAGAWQTRVDEQWTIAVNAHTAAVFSAFGPGAIAIELPPFHAAIWFNGWAAGLFDVAGG